MMDREALFERMYDAVCDPWTLTEDEKEEEKKCFFEALNSGDIADYVESIEETRDCICRPFGVHGCYDFEEMRKFDCLIEELKSASAKTETKKENNMTTGLFKDKNGYVAYRHNGIKYSLFDGVTMGRSSSSDIAFLMLESYENIHVEYIAYQYGSFELEDERNLGERIDWIDQACEDWENKHPDTVERIWKGEVEEI